MCMESGLISASHRSRRATRRSNISGGSSPHIDVSRCVVVQSPASPSDEGPTKVSP